MARHILKTHDDLVDFVQGCLLYGVGGGGNPAEGLKALEEQMEQGNELAWVDPEDLPDGTWAACAFLMGSTAPLTPEKIKQREELGMGAWIYPRNLIKTTEFLQEYTKRKISALIPLEMGGSNTPAPLAAAAALGISIVNGDFAGRAVPEICQTLPVVNGIPFTPATSFDKYGNKSIIVEAISIDVAERIGKYISEVSFGSTGLCGFMIPTKEVKKHIVANTMSDALKAGRIITKAKKSGKDISDALCGELGFYKLFTGVVKEKPWEDRDGYYWGNHIMEGTGAYAGQNAHVFFKNENHIFYLNGKLIASSPDLIFNIDNKLQEAKLNDHIKINDELTILGAPCKPEMRSEKMLPRIGPSHYGVDLPYVPIEQSYAQKKA